jgi:signal peptide peptidase-like protein 2B
MLAAAAAVLVSLYLLVRAGFSIIYFVIGVFALGSFQALVLLAFLPGLRALPRGVGKRLESITLLSRIIRGAELRVSAAQALAFTLAAGCVVTWVLLRHAGWAWLPQDAFGVALCCMFLLQLQLNGLRDACVLLALFFAYDVFMVFLSPFVFGSSVMIDVATAGAPVAVPNWACYCRANPGDASSCGPGEIMPILLRLPRVSGYRGGYAMLGLGDIVLPGLLLSLCLRFDLALKREGLFGTDALALRRARRRAATLRGASYWQVGLIGYGLGIALAMAAVAAFKSGQPALLYLVPCTVVPVLVLASVRGDLPLWWRWRGIDAGMTAEEEEGSEGDAGGTGAALTGRHDGARSDGAEEGEGVPVVVGAAPGEVGVPTPAAGATVATADAALAAYEAIALHAGTEDTHGAAISPQGAPAAASTGAGSAAPAYPFSGPHASEDDSEGDTEPLTRSAAGEKAGRARAAPPAARRGRRSGGASRGNTGSTAGDATGASGVADDAGSSEGVNIEMSTMPSGPKDADRQT